MPSWYCSCLLPLPKSHFLCWVVSHSLAKHKTKLSFKELMYYLFKEGYLDDRLSLVGFHFHKRLAWPAPGGAMCLQLSVSYAPAAYLRPAWCQLLMQSSHWCLSALLRSQINSTLLSQLALCCLPDTWSFVRVFVTVTTHSVRHFPVHYFILVLS